jgi:hypothetical protein
MYEGSMRGAGGTFFAVWGYVIANMKPNRSFGCTVELNPEIVAFLIGDPLEDVEIAIRKMCEPDSRSRTKVKEGRRLERVNEYMYLVVNGDYYRSIRTETERREYQRKKQAEYRRKKRYRDKPSGTPLRLEGAYCKAAENGTEEDMERIIERSLSGACECDPPESVEDQPQLGEEVPPPGPNPTGSGY